MNMYICFDIMIGYPKKFMIPPLIILSHNLNIFRDKPSKTLDQIKVKTLFLAIEINVGSNYA